MSDSMLRKPPPVVDLVVQPDHTRHSGLQIYRKSKGRQRPNFDCGSRGGDSLVYDGA
jgi:hypothetical protein